jgi:hypothetical protein
LDYSAFRVFGGPEECEEFVREETGLRANYGRGIEEWFVRWGDGCGGSFEGGSQR